MKTTAQTEFVVSQRVAEQEVRKELFRMTGDSYERVATRAAVKLYGSGCFALRTTGTSGRSGFFRAYRNIRGGGATSVGEPFHLM